MLDVPYADQLRSAGLRVTAQRIAVMDALEARPHSDAGAVAAAIRHGQPISTQAVYDVLDALADAALVRRIEPAGSTTRYELRTGDNHHHLVCRDCGRVDDVDCAVGSAPCLEPAQQHGYNLDEAEVTYWGVCPACSESNNSKQTGIEGESRV